jgi:hypothetical protein
MPHEEITPLASISWVHNSYLCYGGNAGNIRYKKRRTQKSCMIEYRFLKIYVCFRPFIRTVDKIFASRVEYTNRDDQNIGLYET